MDISENTLQKPTTAYPLSICILHWAVALTMISTLFLGLLLDDNMELMGLHRSLGILVLLLGLARLANRLYKRRAVPASVNTAGSTAYLMEKTLHGMLYLSMLVIPLLGWLKTNAAGHSVSLFGLLDLPRLLDKQPVMSHLLGALHSFAAYGFLLLLVGHLSAVAVHWSLNRSNLLLRILPQKQPSK